MFSQRRNPLTGEPAANIGAFGTPLDRMEAGDCCNAVMHQRRMGDIDHVRTSGLRVQQRHIRNAAQDVVKALPLGEGRDRGKTENVSAIQGFRT